MRWPIATFPELRAHVKAQGFSAAWASRMTDVPADVIRVLAREYARARPAAIFCNAGISHQMNAFHTYRALAFLAAITTPALEKRLAAAGHAALPPFYSHPETTGDLPTVSHSQELVENPINPGTLTPKATLGVPANRPAGFPLVGMIGRPSVAHFATMTHWLASAEQLNGIRLIQIHPRTAGAAKIANGDTVRVESPRGAVTGTALLFDGIREDTIFVPNTFGPAQRVAEENDLPLYEPANLLLDDRYFDNLSGQQAYKCFACRVVKA